MPECGTNGRARWARLSKGRGVLIRVVVVEFQGSGLVRNWFHFEGLSELVSLNMYGEGKFGGRWAAAVHIGKGVHASVIAAIRLLCARRRPIRGRAASTARMLTGVVEKQLVTYRWTLCQKTSIFCVVAPLGTKRSPP